MSSDLRAPAQRAFVGVFDPSSDAEPERLRRELTNALNAPAPAAIVEPGFSLAHTGADVHRSGAVLCTFHGRLANLRALRAHVGSAHELRPAELVATLIAREGDDALQRLRGEFVVVLWNSADRSGLIARDPLGARTVFLHEVGGRLTFASDVRVLLRRFNRRPGVDERALMQWLLLGGALDGHTLYTGIRRLAPGTILSFGSAGASERKYWALRYSSPLETSRDDAAAELSACLHAAVARHAEPADRVGLLLSGGLDSGTLAGVGSKVLRERGDSLVAYSMTFPRHQMIDESSLIEAVADHAGLASVQMRVFGGSMLIGGLEFLQAWDLPTSVPNTLFIERLQSHAASQGITVMLDGDGGDELFGADEFLAADYLRAGRIGEAWRLCRRIPGVGDQPPLPRLIRAFRVLALRGAMPYWVNHARRSRRRLDELAPDWLAPAHARAFAESYDPWQWKRSAAPLWWSHLVQLLTGHPEMIWTFDYLRQTALLSGLEDRHPLLDPDLIELVLRLPPEYAYDQRFDRALLRHSVRGLVPEPVRSRADKSLFTQLVRDSLFGSDSEFVKRTLGAPDAELRAFVNMDAVRSSVETIGRGEPPRGLEIQLWRLLMAEYWLRSQADAGFPERLLSSGLLSPATIEFVERPLGRSGGRSAGPAERRRPTFSGLDHNQSPRRLPTVIDVSKEVV